jgi:D-alanyl-D-alanine carboxypeptidase
MKKITALAMCAFIFATLFLQIFAYGAAAPDVISETAVIIDADSGQVLYDKDKDKKMYPASTTKILTGLLAVENGDMGDVLTATANTLAGVGSSSHIALSPGEQMTVENAMYAMSVESANDAANLVGEYVSAKLGKDLSQLMTDRAKELGAVNSNFVNASGLHDDNHYTTAYDLALIAKECVKHDDFNKIFSAEVYTIPRTNKHEVREIHSSNWFLNKVFPYDGIIMSKIGWTDEATHTMVTCCKRGDLKLICVVMKSTNRAAKWDDTKALFDWAFSTFKRVNLSGMHIALAADEETTVDKTGRLYVKKKDIVCPDASVFMTAGDDEKKLKYSFTNPVLSADLSTVTMDVEIYTGRKNNKNVLATLKATAKVSERSARVVQQRARVSLAKDLALVTIFSTLTFTAAMISDILINKRIPKY